MLIVPGFAAAAFSNLYELFTVGMDNTSSLFKQLFEIESGDLFLNVLLQQGGLSFLFKFGAIVELIVYAYFSSTFYVLMNRKQLEKGDLTKTNDDVFPFGMDYSLTLVFVGIGCVFRYDYPQT